VDRPVLLLDLGNRRLKLAELQAGQQGPVESLGLPREEAAWPPFTEALARRAAGRPVRLSSVHPAALARLRPGLEAAACRLDLAGEHGWPMEVRSRGTGADRVMAAWAAWRRCGAALAVADCGTAFTLDLVDGAGVFRGGAIGPGLGVQVAALAAACPHLPAPGPSFGVLPEDSAAAVAAGTRGALAASLEGLRVRFGASLGAELRGFLTGGDAGALRPELGPGWTLAEDLVLEGLAAWTPGRVG
jgi:type III pantothenate kinase